MSEHKIQIKRIQLEIVELKKNMNPRFSAGPVDNDLFNWHFTIRGPKDSDFEKGIYHGKIIFPVEYPFKPPDLYFLTPNGRYETNTKICLSVTKFHPEEWSPSWTIRTMLEAIISTLPEVDKQMMGLGGLKTYSNEDIKKFAIQSQGFICDQCGPTIKLVQIDDIKCIPVDDEGDGGIKPVQSDPEPILNPQSPNPNLEPIDFQQLSKDFQLLQNEFKKIQQKESFQLNNVVLLQDLSNNINLVRERLKELKQDQEINIDIGDKDELIITDENQINISLEEQNLVEELKSMLKVQQSFQDKKTLNQYNEADIQRQNFKNEIVSLDIAIFVASLITLIYVVWLLF